MQNAKFGKLGIQNAKFTKKIDPKIALEIVNCEMIISSRALQR